MEEDHGNEQLKRTSQQMTDAEICREYRTAKNKKQQINILMDLNTLTREEVIEILTRGGEDLSCLKRKRRSRKVISPEELCNKEKGELPEPLKAALCDKLEELDKEIKEKEQQYRDIAKFIQNGVWDDVVGLIQRGEWKR